ncbi:hypothetical protein CLV59_105277 [Chitinophaga dinghuensis]|uniref:Uncharacterized protein n=1 Tax=Chitinophaga dinghuensis TaxID=1539050 RepID=A0A327VW50_9BACT|nr:hypothetical protein [Chitinophaga dinghuensis]RAJ80169.1 hypothetical protein CLV59_105277 [Chitinophaga dinghuensis]
MNKLEKKQKNREINIKTQQARKFVVRLTIITLLLEVLVFFKGQEIKGLAYGQLLLILIFLYGFYHFRSLLMIENKTTSFFSEGMFLMIINSFSLWSQTGHYDHQDTHPLWLIIWPTFGVLMLLFLIAIWALPLSITKCVQYVFVYGLMLLSASYGVIAYTNVRMDDAPPVRNKTIITDRYVSDKSRYIYYYIMVSGREGNGFPEKIEVEESFYESVNTGQEITIDVYPGKLNVPWFKILGD